jgi:hypothetical protein
MSTEHYLPHQYDIDNIIYGNIETLDSINNKLIIQIYDKEFGKPLYIQTPELLNLFGVINKKTYNELFLPLGGIQCLSFKNLINKLQNKVLSDANFNKNSWFNQQKSVKFIPIIKELNKDATSTIEELTNTENLSRCDDGLLKIKITDSTIIKKENVEISVNELTKNKKVRMIIYVYAIWVNKNTFGIYIKPEIIEEKNSFNLTFIEDKLIFESENEESELESDSEINSEIESEIELNILQLNSKIEEKSEENLEKKIRRKTTSSRKSTISSKKSNKK